MHFKLALENLSTMGEPYNRRRSSPHFYAAVEKSLSAFSPGSRDRQRLLVSGSVVWGIMGLNFCHISLAGWPPLGCYKFPNVAESM